MTSVDERINPMTALKARQTEILKATRNTDGNVTVIYSSIDRGRTRVTQTIISQEGYEELMKLRDGYTSEREEAN